MDRANMIAGIDEATNESSDKLLVELNDLQLAYVGGGSADPIYH